MEDRKSLKQALDDGCGELGEEMGEDIPNVPLLHRLTEVMESNDKNE